MAGVDIDSNGVELKLNMPRGIIRIADENGNHVSKPTEARYERKHIVEWMITNDEVEKLVRAFLGNDDRAALITDIERIKNFIRETEYANREAAKTTLEEVAVFEGFRIFKYTENFYSFEKELSSKIRIRIVFKMGDYTLAPHMFVLLPFSLQDIEIENNIGKVQEHELLGSGCHARWKPKKSDVKEIVVALAHLSGSHRNDLVRHLS